MRSEKRAIARVSFPGLASLTSLTFAAGLAAAFPAHAQTTGKKPNIVLILSDDFGYGDSGPYDGGVGRGMPTGIFGAS